MAKPKQFRHLFAQLYETKVRELRENLNRLDLLLSRHNFYDCQTVLALSTRKANAARCSFRRTWTWMQMAPMVIGFRLATACRRRSNRSPVFAGEKNRIVPIPTCQESKSDCIALELEQKTATPERKRDLKNAVTELRDEIAAMKKYSYLIGTYDPFIVVPASFTKGSDAAHVGDYAFVIAGSTIYPAIVGDVGPNDRVGEASLRIAKEVNALSNPNNRADQRIESDLHRFQWHG